MSLTPASKTFQNSDVTGLGYARDFALNDQDGKPRTLADFKGKAVVVFFGYTHCPDVCPTTLSDMAAAMKALGPDADRVQVIFITLDPERDKPELLKSYVPSFDPRFIGLSGNPEATATVAKEFKVFYQKVPGKSADSYTMDPVFSEKAAPATADANACCATPAPRGKPIGIAVKPASSCC